MADSMNCGAPVPKSPYATTYHTLEEPSHPLGAPSYANTSQLHIQCTRTPSSPYASTIRGHIEALPFHYELPPYSQTTCLSVKSCSASSPYDDTQHHTSPETSQNHNTQQSTCSNTYPYANTQHNISSSDDITTTSTLPPYYNETTHLTASQLAPMEQFFQPSSFPYHQHTPYMPPASPASASYTKNRRSTRRSRRNHVSSTRAEHGSHSGERHSMAQEDDGDVSQIPSRIMSDFYGIGHQFASGYSHTSS